jgi:hypothetical protein
MSCPTCNHTMEKIGTILETDRPLFQCPRCGTLKHGLIDPIIYTPDLVERCRQFEKQTVLDIPGVIGRDWRCIGIAESINLPGDRPQ